MKRKMTAFFYTLLILTTTVPSVELLDKIVAIVGDSIILSSELDAYVMLKINQFGLKPDSLEMNMLRYRSLDELIDGKVLIVQAEKDSLLTLENEEIENEIDNRVNYILQQNRLSLKEFEEYLAKEQGGMNVSKFRKQIRPQIRQELLKQKIQQRYISTTKISKNDVEQFYSQYKDSIPSAGPSILLSALSIESSTTKELQESAYAKISMIKQKLDKGEDFVSLAKKYSEDPNAVNGGDLGFIGKGTLNELTFENYIFSLKPGQTSDPFETRLGFHIVQVLEKRGALVHVRQIFTALQIPQKQIDQTKNILDSLKKECSNQATFESFVVRFSTDPVQKNRKGLLRWQSLNQLDPTIRTAFDSIAINRISNPVQINNTVTLYRIVDINQNRSLTLQDDWNEIAQMAQQIYIQNKMIEIVNQWKNREYIDIRL